MTRRLVGMWIVSAALTAGMGRAAEAQVVAPAAVAPAPARGYYAPPGYYGTAYGYASYGMPRTYSVYASPFGTGYGYGYAPYGYVPGFGTALWRPGVVAPGYAHYRSFALPPGQVIPPPFGYYAPAFGPGPMIIP